MKQKKLYQKTKMLAVLLLLLFATFATLSPVANSAEAKTYTFISISANPIGVDQSVWIMTWLDKMPPSVSAGGFGGVFTYPAMWQFEVTITRPDGTTEVKTVTSDTVGGAGFDYVFDRVGTWYIQSTFLGQANVTTGGDSWAPSISRKIAVTVQTDPIAPYPDTSLPTGFWQRPIEADNREWYQISGNWLGMDGGNALGVGWAGAYNATGNFNPYTTAPNTAHILWARPQADGGLIGGEFGSISFWSGENYEHKFTPPVIMDGRLYYNVVPGSMGNMFGAVCVDLRTGEQLWWQNISISCGQIFDYETYNGHGGIPYLWLTGPTYKLYDAFTGNWIMSMTNGIVGRQVASPTGDMLVYVLDGEKNWLAMWNSTKAICSANGGDWGIRTSPRQGVTIDWLSGIQWNVTVPDVPGIQSLSAGSGGRVEGDVLYARATVSTTMPPTEVHVAYSATTGQQLFVKTMTISEEPSSWQGNAGPMKDGVYTEFIKEKLEWYGYDSKTGNQLWGPVDPYTNDWGFYTGFYSNIAAYGKLFIGSYDGMVHCLDIKTGEKLWDFTTLNSGLETPYGVYPLYGGNMHGATVADGKVFVTTSEHTPTQPLWRGSRMYAIDTNTGKCIWNMLGWWSGPVVADGYLLSDNAYDNQIYCFGKGQSAVTVSAPQSAIPLGERILIQGTVTDQSPGQTCLGISAAGTPAIADAYMTPWMEYLYEQKAMPTNATGVPVLLQAVKSDGTVIDIGTVTSDITGHYRCDWNPPNADTYTIKATFQGSESYWSSSGQCALLVDSSVVANMNLGNTLSIVLVLVVIAVAILSIFTLLSVRKLSKRD